MAFTRCRRKDVGGLWQVQYLLHSTHKAQRLCAIRGTASPPLPYKNIGTDRAKKAPLVWSCRMTSRRWADQGHSPFHTAAHVAQTSRRPAEDMGYHNQRRPGWMPTQVHVSTWATNVLPQLTTENPHELNSHPQPHPHNNATLPSYIPGFCKRDSDTFTNWNPNQIRRFDTFFAT